MKNYLLVNRALVAETCFKRFLTLFFAAFLALSAWGESVDFSAQGYTNGEGVTSYVGTAFSVSFASGSKYYDTGTAVRVYAGKTFTVSSNSSTNITGITLTFGTGDNSNTISTNVGTYSAGTWSGSATSITFTVGGTKDHRRIKGIEVTMDGGGSTPYTVTLSKNGSTSDITDCTGTYTLPTTGAHVADACTGWVWHCWTNAAYSPSTPTTTAPSSTVITSMTATGTAYAVYKHTSGGGSSNATINFGYSDWGKTAQYSGTAFDEVTQTNSGITVTQTRNGSNMYANATATRFYGSNTLNFTSSVGNITSIVFSCSTYQTDITSDVGTCTSTSSAFSWSGDATSVTFTRTGSSYAQFSEATVTTSTGTITYTSSPTCLPSCETPTFSVSAGSYTTAQNVTISCATAGATIYYTTDGTIPTTSSTVYSAPVTIPKGAQTTLQAIAAKTGMENSTVASATYDIRVYDITLSIDGVTTARTDVSHGTALSTYDALVEDCSKWTFIGWSKTERASQTITDAMTLVTEVDAACTYYAVFRNTKSGAQNAVFNFATLAETNSWENATRYSPITIGAATLTASTGGNNGKYYTADKTWRIYSSTSPKGTATITIAGGTINSVSSSPSKDFSISGSTASYTASSANVEFKSITVNYTAEANYYSTNATCDPVWTITFNGNGNTEGTAPEAVEVVRTQSTTLPGAGTLVKTHHSFAGWNTKANGTGDNYAAGASFTPTSDITLYAKWIEDPQYTITWDDGHTEPLPTTSVYAGDKVVLPSDPTSCSSTYTNFVGWYTSPEGTESMASTSISGTKVTAQTKPTRDTRYYAVFSNGGTIATSKEYAFNITPDDFTTGGYAANDGEHTSVATATDASGATFKVTWTSQDIYKNGAKMQWKAATNTSYKSRIYNNTDLTNVTEVTVTATDAEARFDIFSGSSAEPSLDFASGYSYFAIYNWDVTTRYTTNIHIEFTATGGISEATGYISSCAVPTTWTVNYNANGKDISVGFALPSATTGLPDDAPFVVPNDNYIASPGFAQIGWNTNPAATEGLTTIPAQTAGTIITLYAIWQKSQVEVVEVDGNNNIFLDHNYGGSTTATLDQLMTETAGSTANDIFFSKYFESTANVKLVAIFNGTGEGKDISDLRIRIPWYDTKQYKYKDRIIKLDTLLNHPGRSTTLDNGKELILYSWQPTSKAGDCYRDRAILESAADKVDMSTWIPLSYAYAADSGKHSVCFAGYEAIVLERYQAGAWQPIDIIGAMDASGHSIYGTNQPSWGDANGWTCASGLSIEDTTEIIGISTNRCLLVRKFGVLDGSRAVSSNIGTSATFSTLCDEWYGKHVQKYSTGSGSGCTPYAQDNNSAADGFSYVGEYDYNSQYQKYEEVAETKFTATYDPSTGFTQIHINPCGPGVAPENCVEGGLAGLACDYLKITVKNAEKTQELDKLEYKVPIIVGGDGTTYTNSSIFSTETECETCDVVVLGNATLTKATTGAAGDQPTVRNLMIYPNGTLNIPGGTIYNVSSIQFRVQGENVPVAKLSGTLHTTNQQVVVSRRINNDDAYFFSLPYNCNIADITWSNGDAATLGDGFKIQEYDAATRANEGSTAGVPGHWKDITGSTIYTKKGYQIMVNSKKLRELIFPMNIETTNVSDAENIKINNTDEVTIVKNEGTATENNWNWNFIAEPYLCAMSPMEGDNIRAGWLKYNEGTTADPGYWTYEDGSNVYFTVYNPSSGTYDQKKFNALSQLDPFVAYFVQGKAAGSFKFTQDHRILSAMPRRMPAEEELEKDASIFVGVTLSGNGQSDETSLRIRPDFTNEYQLGYDLQKFTTYYTERPQIYMKTPLYSLAFQAVSDSVAKNTWLPMGIYCYQPGTFTFALSENNPTDEVEAVYLYDATTGVTTNLLYDTYSITTTKQLYTNKRFSLNVILNRRSPQVTTDIGVSEAPDNMVRKILINGHVYIQRGNALYDVTGKQLLNR